MRKKSANATIAASPAIVAPMYMPALVTVLRPLDGDEEGGTALAVVGGVNLVEEGSEEIGGADDIEAENEEVMRVDDDDDDGVVVYQGAAERDLRGRA